MEDCPHRTFEMAISIFVGHSGATSGAGEHYTTLHTGSEVGARRYKDIYDIVVDVAAHNVKVAFRLESVSIATGTGRGCLRDIAR